MFLDLRFRSRLVCSLLFLILYPLSALAETTKPTLQGYLDAVGTPGATYDESIPTPSSVLGFEVGEWHLRHDQLARYMRQLAESSDRIQLTVTGYTYEQRPLMLLTISSPENLADIDRIRGLHLRLSNPDEGNAPDLDSMPLVVNLGYGVHGDEPSGSNAAPVVAYHLAAAQDEETRKLLDETVILLDPSLNPDGFSRFAHWANTHKGAVPVASAQSREHRQGWPSARTNHYWFDLNRDWLLAQHPESQARLKQFHQWRPNVLTDHHEMGSNSTFFFQPGVPSRKNPLTPDRNVELTAALAEHHARALDALGSLYYSEESFDDFYYGKGSTYPDVHGAVGILFEQASSRGHVREGENGIDGRLRFPFTIRNQVAVSFSTLRGAQANRRQLLEYQQSFYAEALAEGRADKRRAFIFGDSHDPARAALMAQVLDRHHVELRSVTEEVTVDGVNYRPGSAYWVPLAQPQYRLIRALFDTYDEFEDTTFYDVSAWTLPLSHGLSYGALNRPLGDSMGSPVESLQPAATGFEPQAEAYAYAMTWDSYYAPRALYRLLDHEVEVRRAGKDFTAVNGSTRHRLRAGTLMIPMGIQTVERSKIESLLGDAVRGDGVTVIPLTSGLTPSGVDLGSPTFRRVEKPTVALVVAGRTSSYEAGQLWHLMDYRFGVEVMLLPADSVSASSLADVNRLVLVSGAQQSFDVETIDALKTWIRGGGVLVATKSAARWAFDSVLGLSEPVAPKTVSAQEAPYERKPYGDAEGERALQVIGGAIFEADLDLTHPLAFGYHRRSLPMFRNSRAVLGFPRNPYSTVAAYTEEPLMCGYASDENIERLAGTSAVLADRMGRGAWVLMADDPSFRAFWLGTHKLFLNGVFFANQLERTAPRMGDS